MSSKRCFDSLTKVWPSPAMSVVYNVFYNLAKLVARCFFSMRIVHPERMIEEGPLILAINHSSYFDPPLAGICSRRPSIISLERTYSSGPSWAHCFRR
jgi:1-acyl-sn-glycerol-3-phosphate acyltransferase